MNHSRESSWLRPFSGRPGSRAPLLLCVAAFAVGTAGCLATVDEVPERAATERSVASLELERGDERMASQPASTPATPDEPLDLETALALADAHHPAVNAARRRLEAVAGRVIQAGTLPNPRVAGSMDAAPFEGRTTGDAEYLIGATQPVPIGGRLGGAEGVARAEEVRVGRELEATRRRVQSEVRGAFAVVLYADRLIDLHTELHEAAGAGARVAQARFDSGDLIREDVARAELEREEAKLALERATAFARGTRLRLREAIGDGDLEVRGVRGELRETLELPAIEAVVDRIREHPELLVALARSEEGEARIRLAELQRIPDLELGFFYHRFEAQNVDAFDVGFQVPLPLFDRNQGRLLEARAAHSALEAEARATRLSLETRARLAHARLAAALRVAATYRDDLVPRIATVLRSAEARYRAGDASLAELLPVRRDAARLRLAHLDAVRQLAARWAELAELLGL